MAAPKKHRASGGGRALWEYEEDFAQHHAEWVKLLNHYGSQGWELVAVVHDESTTEDMQARLIFKRPKTLDEDGE